LRASYRLGSLFVAQDGDLAGGAGVAVLHVGHTHLGVDLDVGEFLGGAGLRDLGAIGAGERQLARHLDDELLGRRVHLLHRAGLGLALARLRDHRREPQHKHAHQRQLDETHSVHVCPLFNGCPAARVQSMKPEGSASGAAWKARIPQIADRRRRKAGRRKRIFNRELRQLREFSEGKDTAERHEESASSPEWEAAALRNLLRERSRFRLRLRADRRHISSDKFA